MMIYMVDMMYSFNGVCNGLSFTLVVAGGARHRMGFR